MMIEHDSVDLNTLGDNSVFALHEAIESAYVEVARALLSQRRFATVNHQNIGGFSPLTKCGQQHWHGSQRDIVKSIMEDPRFTLNPEDIIDMFEGLE